MAASNQNGSTFDAGTVERVLDEHRQTNPTVEQLFRIQQNQTTAEAVGLRTITAGLSTLNHTVCLVVERDTGTEYLHAQRRENGLEWYSVTKYRHHRVLGPLPIYEHNVEDRFQQYPQNVGVEKVAHTEFATRELPDHDLDVNEVNLDD